MADAPALVLFDIDGTLLRSSGVGAKAWHAAGAAMFGDRFSLEGHDFAGQLDRAMFRRVAEACGLGVEPADVRAFFNAYVSELRELVSRPDHAVAAMPGVPALLQTLQARARHGSVLLGVLTGNTAAAAPLKLIAGGIDPAMFTINAFGDEADLRPDLTRLALRRYAGRVGRMADTQRVIVVGDTPHDVTCATAHGCVALGVATGRFSTEQLSAAGADRVVVDLTDPQPLLEILGDR